MYIYLASLLFIVRLQQFCLCFLGLKLWFFSSFQVTDTYYFLKQNVFLTRNLRLQIPKSRDFTYQNISMLQIKRSVT